MRLKIQGLRKQIPSHVGEGLGVGSVFLHFTHLIVPLTASKVLSLERKKKKTVFSFVLYSLNRTFALNNRK